MTEFTKLQRQVEGMEAKHTAINKDITTLKVGTTLIRLQHSCVYVQYMFCAKKTFSTHAAALSSRAVVIYTAAWL